ncbi:MAG: hypothetical protein OXU63_01850 [Acidobacteriota bacterium]|nr:hypothetical protein [Acidobacteriota bacterium]
MTTTDTLRTARTLTKAGVPDRQADAHARATDNAVRDGVRNLVTRADLYRALLIQAGVIVGAVVALLRLLPQGPP